MQIGIFTTKSLALSHFEEISHLGPLNEPSTNNEWGKYYISSPSASQLLRGKNILTIRKPFVLIFYSCASLFSFERIFASFLHIFAQCFYAYFHTRRGFLNWCTGPSTLTMTQTRLVERRVGYCIFQTKHFSPDPILMTKPSLRGSPPTGLHFGFTTLDKI